MDTPVVPTSGFAGAGYNNPDCAYRLRRRPSLKWIATTELTWASAAGTGHTLTITALGDQMVLQQRLLGTIRLDGSLQPEESAAPLWLWRAGNWLGGYIDRFDNSARQSR